MDSMYGLNYGQGSNPMAGFSSMFPQMQPTASFLPTLPSMSYAGINPVNELNIKPEGIMASLSGWAKDSGLTGSYDPKTGIKTEGIGNLALGLGQGLFNGWLGMQQLDLAKETLGFNKEQFNKNFAAQQKTTNARLEDRQRARVASNAGAYQSVGDYMQQNRV